LTADDPRPALTVFLADDNEADVYLVEMALQESGIRFKLHTVTDGDEAIKTIGLLSSANDCPALAIIDQNPPRLDGDHVVRTIRAHPDCGYIPIIIMKSVVTQRDSALVEQYGSHGELTVNEMWADVRAQLECSVCRERKNGDTPALMVWLAAKLPGARSVPLFSRRIRSNIIGGTSYAVLSKDSAR
jgi:CheY-like chemotaxis protein